MAAGKSVHELAITQFEESDRAGLVALWRDCGLLRPWNDPDRDIDRKLADSPWGLLVARLPEAGGPVGAAMVGYDGHRGSINYLCVAPGHRNRGYGRQLLEHAHGLLLGRGCPKVNLQVRGENSEAVDFYRANGYRLVPTGELLDLGLRLVPD